MPPVTSSWLGWALHKQAPAVLSLGPRVLSWNVAKIYPVAESSAFQPAEESSRSKEGPRVAAHGEEGPDTDDGVTYRAREGPIVGQQTPGLGAPAPGDPALGSPALRDASLQLEAPALTCSVPDGDVVGAPLLQVEGAAHRADRVREAPLHVPLEQRRLAHVHVPQKHDLPVGLPHLPAGDTSPLPHALLARAPGARLIRWTPRGYSDPGLAERQTLGNPPFRTPGNAGEKARLGAGPELGPSPTPT